MLRIQICKDGVQVHPPPNGAAASVIRAAVSAEALGAEVAAMAGGQVPLQWCLARGDTVILTESDSKDSKIVCKSLRMTDNGIQ